MVDLVELTFLKILYNLAAFSAFIAIAVNPVKVQRASLDIFRNAFFILSLWGAVLCCTLLLHSSASDSIHTGAPHNRSGTIAPLYVLYRVSWLSHQLCFADSDTVCINFVHFPDMYTMCSVQFNLLSKTFLNIYSISCFPFLFLRDIDITFDLFSLILIFFLLAQIYIMFIPKLVLFSASPTLSDFTDINDSSANAVV